MIRPFSAFLLALPSAAAFLIVPAQAQSYRQAPSPYYRAAPPPAYDDSLPPPGVYGDDDDQSAPPAYRQVQQVPPPPGGYQSRSLPTPDEEADAIMPPPPGFATPDGRPPVYGHQLDSIPPGGPGTSNDPNPGRPPGSVGAPLRGRAPRPCRLRISRKPARRRNWRRTCAGSSSITRRKSRPARSSSIRRTPTSIWCSAAARHCATACASAARGSPG